MNNFKNRIVSELVEVTHNKTLLSKFISIEGKNLSKEELELLNRQYQALDDYQVVLMQRLYLYLEDKEEKEPSN